MPRPGLDRDFAVNFDVAFGGMTHQFDVFSKNRRAPFITNLSRSFAVRFLVVVDLAGRGAETPRYDAAAAVSDNERSADRFLLRGRTLHGR